MVTQHFLNLPNEFDSLTHLRIYEIQPKIVINQMTKSHMNQSQCQPDGLFRINLGFSVEKSRNILMMRSKCTKHKTKVHYFKHLIDAPNLWLNVLITSTVLRIGRCFCLCYLYFESKSRSSANSAF